MADVVNKFEVKYWPDTQTYYVKVQFPDNTSQELNSKTDLTYTQWQALITTAWIAHTTRVPLPNQCVCPACKKPFDCPNRMK